MDIIQIFGIYLQEIFPPLLFFISFFGLITSKNVIKSIVFILLMQTAVIMFWLQVGAGRTYPHVPPIIYDPALLYYPANIADPLPQALTLTAIIIGFSVIAIIITMLNNLFRQHGTIDWNEMKNLEHTRIGANDFEMWR